MELSGMKDKRSASAKPEVGPPLPAVEETVVTDIQPQPPMAESLLAQVLERDNLVRALRQVTATKERQAWMG
jgi:hypothetical protein